MSRVNDNAGVSILGRVQIIDEAGGKILLDKTNAIHSQNMARILSRALANETNSFIHRLALGNGGTFIDVGGNIVYRQPNDGNNGTGWESRLYRETYSEIVDDLNPSVGTDPGSAGPDNIRPGGGTSGGGADNSVISNEIGKNSNVVVTMVIDENEPSSQLLTQSSPAPTLTSPEGTFLFDEIGLYSPGLPAQNTSGYVSVDVGNKNTTDVAFVTDSNNETYSLRFIVDSSEDVLNAQLQITTAGTSVTYGNLTTVLNGGSVPGITLSGDDLSSRLFFFITDPTNSSTESFGFFNIQSLATGSSSIVVVPEDTPIGGDVNLIFKLANDIWANVIDTDSVGKDAGVINSINSADERERLLSHIIFTPILKSASSVIRIVYTLTISVAPTLSSDSTVTVDS